MVVSWELVAFLLIVAIAAGLVIRGLGSLLDRFLIVLAVLMGATLYITLVWSPGEPTLAKRLSPPESQALGYVSSKACRACHPQNYDTWHASYHRTMTQVASRDTVIAPWEPVEVSGRGRTMRIDIRDGQLWADDVDGMALGGIFDKESRHSPAEKSTAPIRTRGNDYGKPPHANLLVPWQRGFVSPT